MPIRRRVRRRSDRIAPEVVVECLESGHDAFGELGPAEFYRSVEFLELMRAAWERLGPTLLAEWIAAKPCSGAIAVARWRAARGRGLHATNDHSRARGRTEREQCRS